LLGFAGNGQLVWALGVPFNAVADSVQASTRLIVRPSLGTSSKLQRKALVDGPAPPAPTGWRLLVGGAWELYARDRRTPVRLR